MTNKKSYNSIFILAFILSFLVSGQLIFAQTPQPDVNSPNVQTQPEQPKCTAVNPDELEGVSSENLIQIWLSYANCRGININKIPEQQQKQVDFSIWFRGSHTINLSKGLDPALEDYINGDPTHQTPVIIQLSRDTSISEMIELIELGLKYYRGSALANRAYLTFVPAGSIKQISTKPYIAGMTLFKPSFKYDLIPKIEDKVATFVYTIETEKPQHRLDLENLGVELVAYDNTLKLYELKMSASQYDKVANLEWVKLINVVPNSILENQLVKAQGKADGYNNSGVAPTTENENGANTDTKLTWVYANHRTCRHCCHYTHFSAFQEKNLMPPKKNWKLLSVRLRRLSEFPRGNFPAEMRSDQFKNTAHFDSLSVNSLSHSSHSSMDRAQASEA